MKTKWFVAIFFACTLLGQSDRELPDEPVTMDEYKKLGVFTDGTFNGNVWRHVWGENLKVSWIRGFSDGVIEGMLSIRLAKPECEENYRVWPKGGTSSEMVAELDTFYTTKENRLIPLREAVVAISMLRNGVLTGERWDRYVTLLRDQAKDAK